MQACIIGLSINKDLKLRKRKGERKTGNVTGAYKYQQRAAKALVISKPIVAWQNLAKFGTMLYDSRSIKFHYSFSPFSTYIVTLPPPLFSVKPAFRFCNLYYAYKAFSFLCSSSNLSSLLCQHFIYLFI